MKLTGRHAYLQDDDNWTAFVNQLESKTWVAYIQPPPTIDSKAEQVVKYLTRYLTGGPISDHRIVSASRREVTFLAREGTRVGGHKRQVPITLSTKDFTERWSQHIQPDQLTKVRYFGGWSNVKVAAYMQRCRDLAPTIAAEPRIEVANEPQVDLVCESCGSDRMVLISETVKPSWREVLGYGSAAAPCWYAELRDESDRMFWDDAMGEGFNAWYLERLIESAKENEPKPAPPIQLHLRGFASREAISVRLILRRRSKRGTRQTSTHDLCLHVLCLHRSQFVRCAILSVVETPQHAGPHWADADHESAGRTKGMRSALN